MLSVSKYDKSYVDDCRSRVERQISAYDELLAAARASTGTGEAALESAAAAFEPQLFANLVLALDNSFCHRARGAEGKDGNPLNEVRVVCESLLSNGGELAVPKSIRLDPAKSVLGYAAGDEIELSKNDFVALSGAFFEEIERRYGG